MKRIACLFMALIIICCFSAILFRDFIPGQTQIYLSKWELKLAGYYAYVLPQQDQKEFNWNRYIYIYSFGCAEGESDDKYRPMRTWYKDKGGKMKFDISISPLNDPFRSSYSTEHTDLTIESDWVADHKAELYWAETGVPVIVFKDIFGMNVTVSGEVSQDKLIDLVTHLEYIGPDSTSMVNPWAEACG